MANIFNTKITLASLRRSIGEVMAPFESFKKPQIYPQLKKLTKSLMHYVYQSAFDLLKKEDMTLG